MSFLIVLLSLSSLSQSQHIGTKTSICLWPPNSKYYGLQNFLANYVYPISPDCPILHRDFVNCTYLENSKFSNDSGACYYDKNADSLCVGSKRSGSAKSGRVYYAYIRAQVNCTSDLQEISYSVTVAHDGRNKQNCYQPGNSASCPGKVSPPNIPDSPVNVSEISTLFKSAAVKEDLSFYSNDALLSLGSNLKYSIGNTYSQDGTKFHYTFTLDGDSNYGASVLDALKEAQALGFNIAVRRFAISSQKKRANLYEVTVTGDSPQTPTGPTSSTGPSTGLVIGVTVGPAVALIIVVLLIIYFRKQRYESVPNR